MNIVVFEDHLHSHFYPLSLTRPLWDLRAGLYTFRERFERFAALHKELADARFWYFTRDYLAPRYRERYPGIRINDCSVFSEPGEILFINAVKYPRLTDLALEPGTAVMKNDLPVTARIESSRITDPTLPIPVIIARSGVSLRHEDFADGPFGPAEKADFIWDLVEHNGRFIAEDVLFLSRAGVVPQGLPVPPKGVTIIGERTQLWIGEGAVIEPGVVIDVAGGPVSIGRGSVVRAFTRIAGPCAIGDECQVMAGARLQGSVSLGRQCRIGGEVEQSIIQGYTNKYHDGFLGHAYVGEFVNLGALTTNSDLKNDYSLIKVYLPDSRRRTGLHKVGCFMGDFVRTSIGTLINTGASIGPGAMLVHSGTLSPVHVPPFCWFIDGAVSRINWFDEFLASCRQATSRRGVEFSPVYRELMEEVYRMTLPAQGTGEPQ